MEMTSLRSLVTGVLRVIFLRGSPERIFYTRRRFIVALFAALLASGLVQWFFYHDHVVFVVLRVFAEVTMFMLTMVLLTRKVARFRLAYLMLTLVLIGLFADLVLLALGLVLPIDYRIAAGLAAGAVAWYGASSATAWGLRKPWHYGALVMLLYVAATVGLDMAFRSMYEIMAA
jgi:hypothetical protein